MSGFTPVAALIGGGLIGIAVTILLVGGGRVAGISGILGGLVPPAGGAAWRLVFLAGLIGGVAAYRAAGGPLTEIQLTADPVLLIAGGLIVGVGTQIGAGCTSGHGVCGIGRLSPWSIVATLGFMAAAGVTVFVARHVMGGA